MTSGKLAFSKSMEVQEIARAAQFYPNPHSQLNLDLTVYDGERNLFMSLLNDPAFIEVADECLKNNDGYSAKRALLKTAIRITSKMLPVLHEIGAHCREVLELKPRIDFYVYHDAAFNAVCLPPDKDCIYIGLTSTLLEKFSPQELTFVIGHEIGHVLYDHHRFPIHQVLERAKGRLSPLHALKIYSWMRNSEITADRIGLICAQDFESAARAFFKQSSGLTEAHLTPNIQDYLDQYRDLQTAMKDQAEDPADWYSTHPFNPLRVKALEVFSRSQTYSNLIGRSGGEITEKQMEDEIHKFMSLMEPNYLHDQSQIGKTIREFIFWGGFSIAMANGEVEKAEVDALASIVDRETILEGLSQMDGMSYEKALQKLAVYAEKMNFALSIVDKLNILRDLTVICYSDGVIEQSEVNVLYDLCRLLDIKNEFIDDVLNGVLKGIP